MLNYVNPKQNFEILLYTFDNHTQSYNTYDNQSTRQYSERRRCCELR